MKRALILGLVLILFISATVFAGPFVKFDLTLPSDASLGVGVKSDDLSLALTVNDLFTVTPDISFNGLYKADYNWWDTSLMLDIADIDVITNYPIPTIAGIGAGIKGTIHIGTLIDKLAGDSQGSLASKTFDVYGRLYFDYSSTTSTLVPTAGIGFYWEY